MSKLRIQVLVRFCADARKDDFVKRFDSEQLALDYFKFLVSLDFDSLLTSFWHVSVKRGNTIIRSYSKY